MPLTRISFSIPSILLFIGTASAQNCGSLNIIHLADIPTTCNAITVTMLHDQIDRDYLYIAHKEAGLSVYDISDPEDPQFTSQLEIELWDSLHVMNLVQDSIYLYLALGNHFSPQSAGLAIVNVADPESPQLLDYFVLNGSESGAGDIAVEGDYAYLAAMKSGLIILNISDKSDISQEAAFLPDLNYPVNSPNPDLYNVRGLEVENEIVYACFDAGGIRILDCRNKSVIRETGRFANEALYKPFNLPRAYNNLEKEGDLLYVAVDYCGVEILDISDTSQITLKGWWNPYNCPNNNWFTSPVHANELSYNQECHRLFVSTGKSDVYVLDVSDPENPDSCDNYGGVDNSIGTWGVSVHETQMFLSYICTLGVPFASNSSGVKILGFDHCTANIPTPFELVKPAIYPNPSTGLIHVKGVNEESRIRVFNTSMQPVFTGESEEDLSGFKFQEGFYYIVVHSASEYYVLKFVVVP